MTLIDSIGLIYWIVDIKDLAMFCEEHAMFFATSNINNPLLGSARKTGKGDRTGQGVSLPNGVAGQVVEVPACGP